MNRELSAFATWPAYQRRAQRRDKYIKVAGEIQMHAGGRFLCATHIVIALEDATETQSISPSIGQGYSHANYFK